MSSRVALLGHRIGYSASPAMHNAAFAALGLQARYELADVPADRLADAVAALRAPDHLGANVTQPHKLAVCELVDERTAEVDRLGAANTIVRDGRRLIAHNTDLAALATELHDMGDPRRAVVLGAGGASRAVVAALIDAHADVRVINRQHWASLPAALLDVDLVVNATPIGTGSDESPVPIELLRPTLTVLDLVYRPSPTRLVRDAQAIGATARDGAGVLLRQAAASFRLWTGCEPPTGVMEEALRAELA